MIEREIEFTFYVGEFSKYRSTVVLKSLVDEVEEYKNHLVIRYTEDKEDVLYQFILLLWENDIIIGHW